MEQLTNLVCTICGALRRAQERWFLVIEDRWQDKLKILHWEDRLAAVPGIHCACGSGHLQQLVVHWMTTGSLDHPFARTAGDMESYGRRPSRCAPVVEIDRHGGRQIGELSVHRESMQRVLAERPQSLQTILDALLSALHRDSPAAEPEMHWEELGLRGAPPEV